MADTTAAPGPRQPFQNVVNHHGNIQNRPIKKRITAIKKHHYTKFKSNDCWQPMPTQHKTCVETTPKERSLYQLNRTAPPTKGSDKGISEISVDTWLTLPKSQHGIKYDVGSAMTSTRLYDANGKRDNMVLLHLASIQTPFERRMQLLKRVLETQYANGASLVYVREFVEPTDADFRCCLASPAVPLQTLSAEQVDRLRIIIVDHKRKEVMVPYLGFYQHLPYNAAVQVVDHFDTFKATYTKVRDSKVKFNIIFCFTFALHKFDAWMYRPERGWGRQRLVEGLALRWRNLFKTKTPEQLDLDMEFSFPAVQSLLASFKTKVENAPTCGDPQLVFRYE